jgi:phosphoribosylanthranilate isomerase
VTPHETRPRPWVKICGLTRPEDAERAIDLGTDFVGLNFWPRSPRQVDLAAAREIAAAAKGRATTVGVFVNEDPERVNELRDELGLDLVQLHGDEPAEELAAFALCLIRVVRAGGLSLEKLPLKGEPGSAPEPEPPTLAPERLSLQWNVFASETELPFMFLIDAPRDARYGGTGEPWAWGEAREWIESCPRPVLVAGGLRPGRAARALAASGAAGVDVASGVESSPGIKDAEKMRRLMEEVRGAAT